MDKYEFNIKVEQIKKLAAKKSFQEAAAIAKEMNWQKVKDWSTLATVINVQEAAGDYLEARDMAILAYNRNLGGRKLVYKLTELLIKLEDFETAEELYEEYEKMSPHDVNRFLLYFDLRKAQNASDNELVEILEDYKEHEIDEKYMFELAKLYAKTGRKEECIKTCDDIVLWFQDGQYVEKAIQLKQKFGVELTNTQKKILQDIKNQKQDLEATRELMFEEQKQLAAIQSDEIEEAMEEAESDADDDFILPDEDESTRGIKSFFKKAFHSRAQASGEDMREIGYEDEEDDEESGESGTSDAVSVPDTVSEKQPEEPAFSAKEFVKEKTDADTAPKEVKEDTVSDLSDSIDKASSSLRELIEDAKKKLENSYGELSDKEDKAPQKAENVTAEPAVREDKEEKKPAPDTDVTGDTKEFDADEVEIKVDIPTYNNPYDTQNLQAALAKNLSEFMEEEKAEAEALRPQPVKQEETADESEEDEQIEGQLSLADWLEAVREEKYGKQNTREFSKTELEKMLDEKDEKSAAYERIMAEQKAAAEAAGKDFDEKEASRSARAQVMLQAAKTDLAIRTGKATVRLEEAAAQEVRRQQAEEEAKRKAEAEAQIQKRMEEAQKARAEAEAKRLAEAQRAAEEAKQEAAKRAEAQRIAEQEAAEKEQAQRMAEQEAAEREQAQRMAEEAARQEASQNRQSAVSEEVSLNTQQLPPLEDRLSDMNPLEAISSANLANAVQQQEVYTNMGEGTEIDEEKKLSGELAKIFRKYREMPGLESQLVAYFEGLEQEMAISTSEVGNIIISGNSSSDKSDLARAIVRAINYLYPERTRKIAKTTGDSINNRGLAKAMNKLKGTALIVEGAGAIQPKRMSEMLECLEQDTERMIVILEDSDAEMNVLLNFNPEMSKKFNHRIVLKQYTVNELVEMARKFARKRQYEVDDDALLELYLKIDKLRNNVDNIRMDDIKEIINHAIVKAEKRGSKRFFGGLKRKRSENGDVIILTEADFKD